MVPQYVQTNLTNLFGRRPEDPISRQWWLFISLPVQANTLILLRKM
jgi:hypothetical protein